MLVLNVDVQPLAVALVFEIPDNEGQKQYMYFKFIFEVLTPNVKMCSFHNYSRCFETQAEPANLPNLPNSVKIKNPLNISTCA